MVAVIQGLIFLQGFFIALAQLDRQQAMIMIRPVYIYVLPAYYYVGKRLGGILPKQAVLLSVSGAISSFLLVSVINMLWLEIPFAHTVTDLYILTSSVAVSIVGGIAGRKKAVGSC